MTWVDVVVAAMALAIGIRGAWVWGEIWRGERGLPYRTPAAWPFGNAIWHGILRTTMVGLVFCFVVAPLILVRNLPEDDPVVMVIRIVCGSIGAVALGVLVPAIVLWNRPKRLVPPYLRDQPGAIAEWRGTPVKPTAGPPPLVWPRRRHR